MNEVTTYVGIDAHQKDLFIAMLTGKATTPVTWQLPNEPNAVRRLVRKLEREAPGPVRVCYEAGPGSRVWRSMMLAPSRCPRMAPAHRVPRRVRVRGSGFGSPLVLPCSSLSPRW
jgi:hypothetical protein